MEVFIESKCWDKIISYARSAYDQFKAEIGGMAIVHRKEDSFLIEDPVILKQEVSSGNCILDKEALAEYYVKKAMEHEDKEELSFLWWHSHHTMGAFWSQTDLKAIEEMSGGKYSFSLVVNLKNEYKFRVSIWDPIEMHKDIEITKVYDMQDVDKEVKVLCTKPEVAVRTYYSNGKANQYNANQLNMYGSYNSVQGDGFTYPPKILVNEVDTILKKLTVGESTEKQTKKALVSLNKTLENKCEFRVLELTVPQLKDCMYFITARDIIHHISEKIDIDDLYDTDFMGYNNSYGAI